MKTNKFINFILEISQVFLVFLGVYSSIMCAALSLSLPVNRLVVTIVVLGAAFLFYGLFTVLETFHHGKVYGMLGITAFYLVVILRFGSALQKGVITIANIYLKEFMSYTQTTVTLLSGKGFEQETASVGYCTSLVIILVAVYLTALISSCFYRKRRSSVYIASTILFFFVPITIGNIGYFSNVVTYIFTSMAVVGTRFLRYDTTDKRMRQKLSLVLAGVGVVAGVVTFLVVSPQHYAGNMNTIVEMRNSALAVTTWEKDEFMTWVREYFSGDALEYGKIGKKNRVTRNGKTLMKIKGDFETDYGLYLKGYTGAVYEENRWRQIRDDGEYEKEKSALMADGLSVDNWHVMLRNQIGESQTTGNEKLWNTGKIVIKNLAFGYGNYVVPYFPTTSFSYQGGRSSVTVPGVQYEVEYFPILGTEMKRGLTANNYNLASNEYWVNGQANRDRMTAFVQKYYLTVPQETVAVIEEYKAYLNSQDSLLDKYNLGAASLYQIVEETRNFIMQDTKYTLSPGRTPSDKDAVVYFLKENKKGYSNHYATAAAVLLRGIGIPTRYVEGVYITKESLADVLDDNTEITVSDKDIHAWVEVYQGNYGFIPMEFTPGRGEEEAENSSVVSEDSQPDGDTQTPGNPENQEGTGEVVTEEVPSTPVPEEDMTFQNIESDNYNREGDEQEAESTSESAVSGDEKKPDQEKKGFTWWQVLIVIVAVLLGFVVAAELQRRVRIILFKKNVARKTMGGQIILYYHQLEKAFVQKGVRYRGQSVSEYTEEIAAAYGLRYEEVYTFVATVFCARFSNQKFERVQVAEFRNAYRRIRHNVYGELHGMKKLYYMYVLCV